MPGPTITFLTCSDLCCLARLTVDGAWARLQPMLAAPRRRVEAAR